MTRVVHASDVSFRVLGELEIEGVSQARLGGPKQRALLAYLLLRANELVPRDRLVDAVWGENPPPTARSIVQGYVRKLRAALEETSARIVTRSGGYVLELDSDNLDVRRFERLAGEGREALAGGDPESARALLEEALALWRGEPLADLMYEPAVEAEARHLADLWLEATMDRIDAELALPGNAPRLGELESLVARHPLSERLRGQLMLAYYRSGRQGDALAAYRETKRTLAEELGMDPGPNLQQLEARILSQDPRLETPTQRGKQPRRRVGRAIALAVLVAVAVATATAFVTTRPDRPPVVAVAPNSVAVIDPHTNKVVGQVRVGTRPGPIAVDRTGVWVANIDDETLMHIDVRKRSVAHTITLNGIVPRDVATGEGAVWVADGVYGMLVRVSPELDRVAKTIRVGCGGEGLALPASVAVGGGGVWFVCGVTLARVDPATNLIRRADYFGLGPSAIAANGNALWVSNLDHNDVWRVNPTTMKMVDQVTVGSGPAGIVADRGTVWVAAQHDDVVSRIAGQPLGSPSTPVGNAPVDVAAGDGAIWVANSEGGTVSRIDPGTRKVVATIRVGNRPAGIAAGDGAVWVAVQANEQGGLPRR